MAPKFLSDSEWDWREDFIAIASVTGEGTILAGQNVSATVSNVHDLASLIGHVFAEEFFAHRRTPLRVYQRRRWREVALDGDLDVDEALVPDPDGLPNGPSRGTFETRSTRCSPTPPSCYWQTSATHSSAPGWRPW